MINFLRSKKIQHSIAILLSIVIMAYASQWLWVYLIPNDPAINTQQTSQKINPQTSAHRKTIINNDMRDILSANIFKQNIKKVAVIKNNPDNIPKTKQALFLKGLISSSNAESSIALIATKSNGSPLPYRQSDKLPNNSGTLHLILQDSVQIKRNNRLEKLMLIKNKNGGPLKSSEFKRTIKPVQNTLDTFKASYQRNSHQLLNQFGLKKTTKGIKLSTRKGRLPAGLRANDIITSVNGYSLNDIENNPDLIEELIDSGNIEASLERNGRTIHFKIPQKLLNQWKKSR